MYAAYFCFVNFGLLPGQYDALPEREKLLIWGFIEKYIDEMKRAREEAARK